MVGRRQIYEAVLSREAANALLSLSAPKRRRLIPLIEQLSDDPFVVADEILADTEGRELCCIRLERWEITYRVDHAAKELRIVDLEEI